MEFLVFLCILLALSSFFLAFWVRNLISKIKVTAEKRQETINVCYGYIDVLNGISSHEMWSGEPTFRNFKIQTENFIRYLQTDELYSEIKFLFEDNK